MIGGLDQQIKGRPPRQARRPRERTGGDDPVCKVDFCAVPSPAVRSP